MFTNILLPFKTAIRLGPVNIDNWVFKLHYKFTSIVLILCTVLITTKEYFGDAINCFVFAKEIPKDILSSYCWVQSTFTLPDAATLSVDDDGAMVAYPGVDKYVAGAERKYHSYYQWTSLFLALLAILFYVPHFIWKNAENSKLQKIVGGLDAPLAPEDARGVQIAQVSSYVSKTWGRHSYVACVYFLCEMLNFVNVVGQIFFVDEFLGGEFTTYGIRVVEYSRMDQPNRTDPMVQVFPRLTKCTFRKFGVAGSVQEHNAMCVLPVNILNEKIFIFLWFWFVILAVVSGVLLLYRMALLCFPTLRWMVMRYENFFADGDTLKRLNTKGNMADWLFLSMLCDNLDSLVYIDLINAIDKTLNSYRTDEEEALIFQSEKRGAQSHTLNSLHQ